MIIGVICDLFNKRVKNVIFLYNFFILFIVVSVRYGIGPDYLNYEQLFLYSKDLFSIDYEYFNNNPNNLEYGYLLIESIVKTFTNEFPFFIIIYNTILFFILFLSIQKYKVNKNIQLFIFFTLIHLYYISGHRQAMAMVIIYYNISNILNRNLVKFLIYTLLAYLFHRSSLIFIFAYLLGSIRLKRSSWLIVLLGAALSPYFIDTLINYLYSNYKDYSYIFQRIYFYYFEHHNIDPVNPFNYIKVVILAIVAYLFYEKIDYRLSMLIFLYAVLFMMFSKAGGLAFRIADLFLISSLYYFATVIERFKTKARIIISFCIILYCSLSFLRIIYVHIFFNVDTFLPYKTFFM